MKTSIIVLALVALNLNSPGLKITNEKVSLIIEKTMTSDQLKDFKKELWAKKRIKLDVERLTINRYNEIENITITVDCGDGFKGSASMNMQMSSRKIGFYRLYDRKSESPFEIGCFD